MIVKIFRRGSARCIGLLSAFITILICLYYISMGQSNISQRDMNARLHRGSKLSAKLNDKVITYNPREFKFNNDVYEDTKGSCSFLSIRDTNITSSEEFAKFEFQPEWIRTKEYWDKTFEERFESQKKNTSRPNLKIIVVPHSHNDPGWLKTFTNYFQSDSRQILNLVITKMQDFKDMTFIWSEISFLQLWWEQAHPTKQRVLKNLIQSGRFEITTGGWVMTDEANVHLYAMLDQLIEGHQWLKSNLNVTPKVGWSIDPFGHGSTVPYLLSGSDFDGTIIQRIHYAWKQWFARTQTGDFNWMPFWKTADDFTKYNSLLTHNMPFDIYSIKHSCGPHPFICLNFDFRKIPGEYTEYSIKAQFITDDNVAEKAQLLLEQYARTASLFPHNVALIPVGDDFRYNKEKEIEQQYTNYKKLIDHINDNKDQYHAEISFGTPKDYFREIKKRIKQFPTFKGDFFVYSDIFSEGRPAYWSGYFTTRPFYKILSTDLENNLRSTEILFSLAFNLARQNKNDKALKVFEKNYEKMILARRNLGLFQHHDAITGTSKSLVMRDYGVRLFESIQDAVKMQSNAIEFLVQNGTYGHSFILSELERDSYNKLPRKTPISFGESSEASIIIYNSLAQEKVEIVSVRSTYPNVSVVDQNGAKVSMQINPVWNITDELDNPNAVFNERIKVSLKQYEIVFLAKLPPLSLVKYKIVQNSNYKDKLATIYCNECNDKSNVEFNIKNKQPGDIQVENYKMRLLFDEKTGFLKTVTKKNKGKPIQCGIKFAAYKSAQFHSGAYLFKTDPEQREAEKDVLEQYDEGRIIITSGPLASDVTVIYGPFMAHTVRIFNTRTYLDRAIYIENDIDFEPPPKNRETELFMRFLTEIENGDIPHFYSDQNGFQFHKRTKVPSIGIEGNYFPITSAAFVQDANMRLTILTNHAQGAASLEPGQLEVMLDRRMLYDDYRGMGEGIVDSRLTRHKFWVLIEDLPTSSEQAYQVPSLLANSLANSLRYPPNVYFIENFDDKMPKNLKDEVLLLRNHFPCDLHLLTIRTLTDDQLPLFPSRSALLILHRQGFDCKISPDMGLCKKSQFSNNLFEQLAVESVEKTTLTGLQQKGPVQSFSEVKLEPMEVQTFNFTFSL